MPTTRSIAHNIIAGIEEMEANKMLARGAYLTNVVNPDLQRAGSICEGRQACLIGSAFWAAGEREIQPGGMLRGVSTAYRANFVADKPALQLALLALDDAANPYIEGLDEDERADVEEWLERRRQRVAPGGLAEALFEATNFAERNMVALLFDAHDCINARSEVGA